MNPKDDRSDESALAREWEALRNLSAAVREATAKVDGDREANEKRILASVRKMRWFRRAGVVGVIAGVLGIVVGSYGLWEVHQLYEQRRSSRILTCKSDNDNAVKLNRLVDQDEQTLRIAFAQTTDPRATAFLQARIAAYETTRILPRDCSSAAIERFYQRG